MCVKNKKLGDIVLTTFFGVSLIILIYSFVYLALFYIKDSKVKYQDTELRQKCIERLSQEETCNITFTENEVKNILEEQTGVKFMLYLNASMNGKDALLLPTVRTVLLNNDVHTDVVRYTITLAHELMHLKYFQKNEISNQFNTFKFLFENENNQLKTIGIIFGKNILNRFYEKNYDCSYLIAEYLLGD